MASSLWENNPEVSWGWAEACAWLRGGGPSAVPKREPEPNGKPIPTTGGLNSPAAVPAWPMGGFTSPAPVIELTLNGKLGLLGVAAPSTPPPAGLLNPEKGPGIPAPPEEGSEDSEKSPPVEVSGRPAEVPIGPVPPPISGAAPNTEAPDVAVFCC